MLVRLLFFDFDLYFAGITICSLDSTEIAAMNAEIKELRDEIEDLNIRRALLSSMYKSADNDMQRTVSTLSMDNSDAKNSSIRKTLQEIEGCRKRHSEQFKDLGHKVEATIKKACNKYPNHFDLGTELDKVLSKIK